MKEVWLSRGWSPKMYPNTVVIGIPKPMKKKGDIFEKARYKLKVEIYQVKLRIKLFLIITLKLVSGL